MRKQFDLQYYLEHPDVKVVTRDGRTARIIFTELKRKFAKVEYPIVASFFVAGNESIETYTSNGEWHQGHENDYDLFFDLPYQEKKRVPLTSEDLLERIKAGKTMWIINELDTVYNIVDFDYSNAYYANGDANELLPISYEDLMGITFVDGDHCWKEE